MSILIICGSGSDVTTMQKTADCLKKKGVTCRMRVCSAHRTPEKLDEIIKEVEDEEKDPYQAIIAGAGLSAALPGVIASKTTLPVIGVPLSGAFEGIDALLSVMQMPPGIPVMSTGVDNAEEAAEISGKIAKNESRKVNIVANNSIKTVEKAAATLKQLRIPYSNSSKIEKDAINIVLVDINEKVAPAANDTITIFCPTSGKETAADALKMLQLAKTGVWVGLNRGENAALAAAEILEKNNEVKEYRWALKIKVENADKEVNQS